MQGLCSASRGAVRPFTHPIGNSFTQRHISQSDACMILLLRIHAPNPVEQQSVHKSEADASGHLALHRTCCPSLFLFCPHLALQDVVYLHVIGDSLCAIVHGTEGTWEGKMPITFPLKALFKF